MDSGALAVTFWSRVLPEPPHEGWRADAQRIWHEAQARRARAEYNTGSITAEAVYCLRAVCEYIKARVVIEVGTFIGTSAMAMASAPTVRRVYTCDVSNNCLPSDDVVQVHPMRTSTQMLSALSGSLDRAADLCFFDGVLNSADVRLLQRVTHQGTVYVFDDYCYGPKLRKTGVVTVPWKGIGNVRLLQPHLLSHHLVEPSVPATMLAALVPEGLL